MADHLIVTARIHQAKNVWNAVNLCPKLAKILNLVCGKWEKADKGHGWRMELLGREM